MDFVDLGNFEACHSNKAFGIFFPFKFCQFSDSKDYHPNIACKCAWLSAHQKSNLKMCSSGIH